MQPLGLKVNRKRRQTDNQRHGQTDNQRHGQTDDQRHGQTDNASAYMSGRPYTYSSHWQHWADEIIHRYCHVREEEMHVQSLSPSSRGNSREIRSNFPGKGHENEDGSEDDALHHDEDKSHGPHTHTKWTIHTHNGPHIHTRRDQTRDERAQTHKKQTDMFWSVTLGVHTCENGIFEKTCEHGVSNARRLGAFAALHTPDVCIHALTHSDCNVCLPHGSNVQTRAQHGHTDHLGSHPVYVWWGACAYIRGLQSPKEYALRFGRDVHPLNWVQSGWDAKLMVLVTSDYDSDVPEGEGGDSGWSNGDRDWSNGDHDWSNGDRDWSHGDEDSESRRAESHGSEECVSLQQEELDPELEVDDDRVHIRKDNSESESMNSRSSQEHSDSESTPSKQPKRGRNGAELSGKLHKLFLHNPPVFPPKIWRESRVDASESGHNDDVKRGDVRGRKEEVLRILSPSMYEIHMSSQVCVCVCLCVYVCVSIYC
jgi:hypothetical protein